MGWVDLIGIGVLGIFIGVGAMRGFLAGVLGAATLVLSYLAAFAASVQLGGVVGERVGLNVVLGGALAGAIAFLCTGTILGLISSHVKRRERRARGDEPRKPADRLGGAAVGAVQGGLIVLVFYWLAWQAQSTGLLGGPEQAEPSALTRVTQEVIRSGAGAVIGDEDGGKLAANMIADPAGTVRELETVLDNPAMRELQHDTLFWEYVSSGAVDAALNRATFLRAAYDESLRKQFADLGLMDDDVRTDPRAFQTQTRDVMRRVAPQIQQLRSDPDLQALANDPAVQKALMEGNPIVLLQRPEFRTLLQRVLSSSTDPPN